MQKIYGDLGTIDLTNRKGPTYSSAGAIKPTNLPKVDTIVEPVEIPDHFLDWLQCLRTRKTNQRADRGGLLPQRPGDHGHTRHGHREAADLRPAKT